MNKKEHAVTKTPTGISGFDDMLEGGIPRGRIVTVTGSVGTGKTILLNEFLYRGITMYSQNGVFVTFEESPTDIIQNIGNFGWDYHKLQEEGKLMFVDFSPTRESLEEISVEYELSPILIRIKEAIKKINAQRIVIDSIASLFTQLSNKPKIRKFIFHLARELKDIGITGMISSEQPDTGTYFSGLRDEEFVTDGVIHLRILPGEQQLLRKMVITKMRGVGYRSGFVQYDISEKGMRIYPKITVRRGVALTSFSVRKRFGIPGLDAALDGGVPQGHIVLISGTTGSGKSLTSVQFLEEGMKHGESGVFVALEEPIEQIRKTAEEHGWDFAAQESKGELRFVSGDLIDIMPDKLLADIIAAVKETGAKRIVLDSISSIMSASLNQEQVRQFLLQLSNFIKSKGITAILTYLMSANFGAEQGQLLAALETNAMRLSSVVDGVILLQYVEREQRVEKLLTVLKMRGCRHSREIFKFEIEKGGIVIGKKFTA